MTATHRSRSRTAWSMALVAVIVATVTMAPPEVAEANHRTSYASGPDHEFGEMVDYPLVFPLAGSFNFSDWFWAARGSGIHHAIDIMAPRWTPVLAVADGTIHSVNYSSNPSNLNEDRCCTIILRHDDNWRSWYIHLNDDSAGLPPGTCDGQGWGIVDGIVPGVRVTAGQHIGWVGSSGNASCNGPHLHYELHDPYGVIVNPYWSLKNPAAAPSPYAEAIAWMFDVGLTSGCNPPANDQYCPERLLTRGEMSTFVRRALGLSLLENNGPFVDHLGSTHRTNINAIREAGITVGCAPDKYCPMRTLTRAEIATLLYRAGGLSPSDSADTRYFSDLGGHWSARAVNASAEAGVAWGCTLANDRFCPGRLVNRGEMAQWLYLAWQAGHLPHLGTP